MSTRIDYTKAAPGVYRAMLGLETYLAGCGLEEVLLHLVKLRVSQINRCAYCLDMHWKDLRACGESEQRLYELPAWRECPFYSARERAALLWAEMLTTIADAHPSDAIVAEVRAQFDDKELADLTLAVVAINGWNRLAISFAVEPGSYEPRRKATAASSG
jgi:AhpD family alkylhydroperoxidase